ncbi:Hypothetical predicted protein [Mytilus galloprovincialis]|uniref:SMP-30/Gluconolactonase/LRE-like region domain-containing protein n=1 Tax=Mytilus galloprovincialis TaxID=29158 RepID=A0A8B6F3E8_MYTGA|nr:Hypothetical predicted protein [Mytilus galloprovincialis]
MVPSTWQTKSAATKVLEKLSGHLYTDDIYSPQGITLDKNGFVYVVSQNNNRVVVVSPDGKTCKTILSEADRIKSLYAIDIDRESGIMIVSSKISFDSDDSKSYQTAFVYKI